MKPESALVQLAKACEAFPGRFFGGFLVGLCVQLSTDPIVMFLACGCVALGFLTNALVAVTVFLLGYAFLLAVVQLANAIGIAGQRISAAVKPPTPSFPFPIPLDTVPGEEKSESSVA